MGPYKVVQVSPYGAVELENKEGKIFKVNRQRIKVYLGGEEELRRIEKVYLDDA